MSLMVIALLQGSVKKAVNAAPAVHRATDCDRQVLTGQRSQWPVVSPVRSAQRDQGVTARLGGIRKFCKRVCVCVCVCVCV